MLQNPSENYLPNCCYHDIGGKKKRWISMVTKTFILRVEKYNKLIPQQGSPTLQHPKVIAFRNHGMYAANRHKLALARCKASGGSRWLSLFKPLLLEESFLIKKSLYFPT